MKCIFRSKLKLAVFVNLNLVLNKGPWLMEEVNRPFHDLKYHLARLVENKKKCLVPLFDGLEVLHKLLNDEEAL